MKTPQEEEVEDVGVEEEGVVVVDVDVAVAKVGILILEITMVQYYNLKIPWDYNVSQHKCLREIMIGVGMVRFLFVFVLHFCSIAL